jgi:hypothetical protein
VANERTVPDFEAMKAAFEVLDKLPVLNHSKQKLEAHLVPVEGEDGSIIGEVVELRTKQGAPVLVMNQADYEDLLECERNHDN